MASRSKVIGFSFLILLVLLGSEFTVPARSIVGYSNFGNTVKGSGSSATTVGRMYATVTTLSEPGTASNITVYIKNTSGTDKIKVAIYDHDSSNNRPGNLLVESSQITVIEGTDEWVDIDINDTFLFAGKYWLVLITNSGCLYYRDALTGGTKYKTGTGWPTFDSPFGAEDGTLNINISIYVKYIPDRVLFFDGFEDGTLDKWDGNVTQANATLEVTNGIAHTGSYSLNVSFTDTYDGLAYVTKQFASQGLDEHSGYEKVNVTFWWRYEAGWHITSRTHWFRVGHEHSRSFEDLSAGIATGRFYNYTDPDPDVLRHYPTSKLGYTASSSYPANDTWYQVSIIVENGVNATILMTRSGTTILTKTGNFFATPSINQMILGVLNIEAVLAADRNIVMYYDDIEVTVDYDMSRTEKRVGQDTVFAIRPYDEDGLSMCLVSTNASGAWGNETWTSFPGTNRTYEWGSTTYTLPLEYSKYSAPICYKFYYNDSLGNVYATTEQYFQVSEVADSIFEWHFEGADTTDYNLEITAPCNITMVQNITLGGDYAVMQETTEGGPKGRGRMTGDIGVITTTWPSYFTGVVNKVADTREIHQRIYFYITEASGSWYMNFLALYSSSGGAQYLMWATVYPNKIAIRRYFPADETDNYAVTITKNRWYCLEQAMYIDDTAGWFKIWLDDTLIIEQTDLNTTNGGLGVGDSMRFGSVHYATIADPFEYYMDDCVLSPNKIGSMPTDYGQPFANNTNLAIANGTYISNAINASATQVIWTDSNSTLTINMRNTSYAPPTDGYCEVYWPYDMNNTIKLEYDNGTIINAETIWNSTNSEIEIHWTFSSNEIMKIYRQSGWSGNVNTVTNPTKIMGVGISMINKFSRVYSR